MTGLSTAGRALGAPLQTNDQIFTQFTQFLQRRKVLWELKLGVCQSQGPTAGSTDISVVLDGDDNPITCRTLIGPPPTGSKVAVIFVPPTGYYIVGLVGGQPLGPLGLVAAVGVSTTGAISTAGSAETDILNLQFKAQVNLTRLYEIRVSILIVGTVTTDTYTITVRRDTAVSGVALATNSDVGGPVVAFYDAWPYVPTANETVSFFTSHARRSGTGTFQAFGGSGSGFRTWAGLYDVGPISLFTTS